MSKYMTPENQATRSAFANHLASLRTPTSTASTLQLAPFKTPSVPVNAVATIQMRAKELFDTGYTLRSKEVEQLRAERDEAVRQALESADALEALQAQYDLLNQAMDEMVVEVRKHAHGAAGDPRGPPPPRANASHGAAGAAGHPSWAGGVDDDN